MHGLYFYTITDSHTHEHTHTHTHTPPSQFNYKENLTLWSLIIADPSINAIDKSTPVLPPNTIWLTSVLPESVHHNNKKQAFCPAAF